MKKQEIIAFHRLLLSIRGYQGIRFNLCISDNIEAITPLTKSLFIETQRIESIKKAYDDERIAAVEELAEKDENGQPIMIKDGAGIPVEYKLTAENRKILDSMLVGMKEKHKKVYAKWEKENKEYQRILEEDESGFKPVMIKEEFLPTNIITEHIIGLKPIIQRKGK